MPRNSNGYTKKPVGTHHKNDPNPYFDKPKPARPATYNKNPKHGLYPAHLAISGGDRVWCCVRGCKYCKELHKEAPWSRKEKLKKHLMNDHVRDVLEDMHDETFRIVSTSNLENVRSRGDGTFFVVGNDWEDAPLAAGLSSNYEAFHPVPMNQLNQPFQPQQAIRTRPAEVVQAPVVTQGVNWITPILPSPFEELVNEHQKMGLGLDLQAFDIDQNGFDIDINAIDIDLQAMSPFDHQTAGFESNDPKSFGTNFENGIGFRQGDAANFDMIDLNGYAVQDGFGLPVGIPGDISLNPFEVSEYLRDIDHVAVNIALERDYLMEKEAQLRREFFANRAPSAAPSFKEPKQPLDYSDLQMSGDELFGWNPLPMPQELVFENPEFLG